MKAIVITLTKEEETELLALRKKSDSYLGERALAILHSNEGEHTTQIAKKLKRAEQTIRSWLNAYKKKGIRGLYKNFSPGRPSTRQESFIPRLPEYLEKSPRDFGWGEDVWSIKVLMAQFVKETGINLSYHTVYRALKDAGYSCKRSKKTPPLAAPSKEEKIEKVNEIISKINNLKDLDNVEVAFLDESHFSTEPYVVRGWSKRGKRFFPTDTEKTRVVHAVWGIHTQDGWFLLEEFQERKL